MSDVLITGMEMPNTCRRCIEMGIPVHCRVIKQEAVTAVMSDYDRPSDCPLIEVPPHGDLIERSSVYKVLDDLIALYKEAGDECNACNIACIEADIVVIPTIIEASTKHRQGD